MENVILNKVIEARNGHYCHALEVSSTYEIENAIEAISAEYEAEGVEALKEFFNTMQIIYFAGEEEESAEDEEAVNNFNTDESINENF
jgi:hypothetical protein